MLLHAGPGASGGQELLIFGVLLTLIFVVAAIVSDLQGGEPRQTPPGSRTRTRRR